MPVVGCVGPPVPVCRDRGPVRRCGPGRDPPRPDGRCPATRGEAAYLHPGETIHSLLARPPISDLGADPHRRQWHRHTARTATVSGDGPRSPARDRRITLVKTLGRASGKQASGYHRQSRVENTFFRYKSIIGDGLRARSSAGQGSEVVLGCEILNRMTAPRPTSVVLHRPVRILSVGLVRASDDSCNNAAN